MFKNLLLGIISEVQLFTHILENKMFLFKQEIQECLYTTLLKSLTAQSN